MALLELMGAQFPFDGREIFQWLFCVLYQGYIPHLIGETISYCRGFLFHLMVQKIRFFCHIKIEVNYFIMNFGGLLNN